jgi:MFS superfamily sulfate permease-like transporter
MTHNFANNFKSSISVFLVALPLCLGIALASGVPPAAGILSGIIGGIIVGLLSGSEVSVSGPAAGLTVIVAAGISDLGSLELFAFAVMLAGVFQILFGFLKLGTIANYFPSSVVEGMLAAIGCILILKQIPHAFGVDTDYFGDFNFFQKDGYNTFTEIFHASGIIHWGSSLVFVISLSVYFFWLKVIQPRFPQSKLIPSSLLAVIVSIFAGLLIADNDTLRIEQTHRVQLPAILEIFELNTPLWDSFFNGTVWRVAITLAIVGSLETLLCMDAADRIDPFKRESHKNRELIAQGIGNLTAGFFHSLPITSVIVRTSANVSAGSTNRSSTIFHGILLLLSVLFLSSVINLIPLSALAAILMVVGFNLTRPKIYKHFYDMGKAQFIPFIVTVAAILFTDLLLGIAIGLVVGFFFVVKRSTHSSVLFIQQEKDFLIRFNKDTSFLQKSFLRKVLRKIPDKSSVTIDGSRSIYIDEDIIVTIEEFMEAAKERSINIQLQKSPLALNDFFRSDL